MTQEFTGSEIVSCKIDPVLFIHVPTPDNFLPQQCSRNIRNLSRTLRI